GLPEYVPDPFGVGFGDVGSGGPHDVDGGGLAITVTLRADECPPGLGAASGRGVAVGAVRAVRGFALRPFDEGVPAVPVDRYGVGERVPVHGGGPFSAPADGDGAVGPADAVGDVAG